MRRVLVLISALVVACSAAFSAQSRTLDIYWIDVEGGGAATLVVTPSGESMLVDTGFETGGAMPNGSSRLPRRQASSSSTTS